MSDPVTNVEIEDVLSSIRRLVSTESAEDREADGPLGSDEDRASATSDDHSPPKKSSPKLVLTPAQRVNDADQFHSVRADQDDAAEADITVEPETQELSADVEDAGAETWDEDEEPTDDLAADDTELQSENQNEDTLRQMVAEEIAAKVNADAASELADQLPGSDVDPQDDTVEVEGFDAEDDISEDDGFDEMSEPDVPEFLRRPVTQMNPPEDAEILSEAMIFAKDAASEPDLSNDAESYAERLESLEAAVADQAEEWEPDGGDEETLTADKIEPLPWNDIEAETADAPEDDVHADAEDAQHPPWFGEDAVMDEDALRDMVGEIVRQELQGALGERITRNVRKLVRREIHRALMSQGLD